VAAPALDPAKVTAIDEGIINPVTLAGYAADCTEGRPVIDVTVVNGREARSIKRHRNKTIAALDRKMSRCADGSRRRKKLARAKKKTKAAAAAALRDVNHQVSRKAADFATAHDTGRIVAGDVRGIEQNTRRKQRANRSTRQQLSQWDRGKHETLIGHKTGVHVAHLDESYSSQTCPACLTRNRPAGRRYRCRSCGFTCHRDAVGAINILMRAIHGCYTRIDPGTAIRVTYLRAVPRWSPDQQQTHRKVARRKGRARSKARNRAADGTRAGCVAGEYTRSSATVPATAAPTGEAA
jgi:putative transposase